MSIETTTTATTETVLVAAPILSYDEKKAKYEEARKAAFADLNDAMAADTDELTLTKLTLAMYKCNADLQKLAKEHELEILAKKNETDRLARAEIFDVFLLNIGINPKEFLGEIYDDYETIRTRLMDGYVKKELYVPMGTTGAKLTADIAKADKPAGDAKANKSEFLAGLLDSGMTQKQIMEQYPEFIDAKGGANGTLRTAVTAYNKRNKS
jgi:hypothetical protein